jgi:hypothetical protein
MRIPALALFFTLPALLSAQTVDELVDTLSKAESLDDEAVGDGGTRSATFRTYEALRDRATKEQLQKLLDHKAPIVRGYAVRALAERNEEVDWPAVLRKFAADAAKVWAFQGCIRSEQLLGDAVIEYARGRKLLSDEQFLDLAETLVVNKSPLFAREQALRTLKFRDGMLHTLRDLAKAGDGPAHVALARFQIPKDLPLLITWLQRADVFGDTTAFLAAQQHHEASLLPVLIALESKARQQVADGQTQRLREWLAAISAQQSAGAAQFLVAFLQATPPQREIVNLCKAAVVPYPGAVVFDEVRAELERHARR